MNKNKSSKKRGFTLIELIVVMAVIGILVLLAAPKFLGYTRKAELVKLQHNIKVVEDAAEIYHMNNEDWPRLTDVPYSAEELQGLAEKYLDETGEVLQLDPDGNYYNIDWEKMKPYIKKPHDAELFVLQNPVGEVFYMEDLTPKGQERIDELQGKEVVVAEPELEYTDSSYFTFEPSTGTITGYSDLGPKSVIIPAQIDGIPVITIGNFAFMDKGLTSIVIPEGVINVFDLSFAGTPNIDFNSGAVLFGNNISSISLPDSLEFIGNAAFSGNKIAELVLPSNIKFIAMEAFYSNLISVIDIPSGVGSIEENAFAENPLTDIYLPADIPNIDSFMAGAFEIPYEYEGAGHYTLQPFGETQLQLWLPTTD